MNVAILLATHNSASFIERQIVSLLDNDTHFTLHWLDDHSSDDTRAMVQALSARLGMDLAIWHQPDRLGVPGAFFRLMECVAADIYLFCDHDDIWQPGKIDAAFAALLPDAARPLLCYSEPWVFAEDDTRRLHRYFGLRGLKPAAVREPARAFMLNPAVGNTVGFTRPLRDLYLSTKEIAWTHAAMHDWWMYLLALASGVPRFLSDVPTTLYRQHRNNVLGIGFAGRIPTFKMMLSRQQRNRRLVARQAAGFLLAAANMQDEAKVQQLTAVARLVQTLDQRQTAMQILALLRRRAWQLPRRRAALLAAVCLLTDGTDRPSHRMATALR